MGIPTNEQTLEPFFDAQAGVARVETQYAQTWVNAAITAQQIKSGPGLVGQISWGKGGAGTITIEDQNGATGGSVMQVITMTAAMVADHMPINAKFANGLRVTQSADFGLAVLWR